MKGRNGGEEDEGRDRKDGFAQGHHFTKAGPEFSFLCVFDIYDESVVHFFQPLALPHVPNSYTQLM